MRWSPQLRVTTKSPGPSSGKTWGRSCTRSAPWSSRYTFVSHVAGDVWFCFVFSLPYWSSTPLKDFVPFMYRSGSCQGWWSKDQRRLRPTVGGHAECFPNLGGVSFLPLSLSLRYPDPSAVQHSKDWLAHVLNVCHSHIVFFFFSLMFTPKHSMTYTNCISFCWFSTSLLIKKNSTEIPLGCLRILLKFAPIKCCTRTPLVAAKKELMSLSPRCNSDQCRYLIKWEHECG